VGLLAVGRRFGTRPPNLQQRLLVGSSDTSSDEAISGLEVKVKSGSVSRTTGFVSKVDTNVRFVRSLVFRETNILVNPHQRSTLLLRDRLEAC